ncbi:MAG: FliH/SctL family protein [Fibrobacterales bacterium]
MGDAGRVSVKSILKAAQAKDAGQFSVGGIKYPTMTTGKISNKVKEAPAEVRESSPKEIIALIKVIDTLKKDIELVRQEGELKAKQAHERGVAEGKAQGYEEGKRESSGEYHSQLNTLKSNLANVFAVLSQEKNFFFAEAEQGAVKIASAIALKFVQHLSQTSIDVITHSVKKGIQALGNETSLLVKVNPDDFDAVEDDVQFWKPVQSKLKDIQVVEDARITRGGCLLETESGTVDVSVNMVVEGIEDTLNVSLQHFGLADTKMSDEAKKLHDRNIEQTLGSVEDETSKEEHAGKIDSAMQHAYEQLEVDDAQESDAAELGAQDTEAVNAENNTGVTEESTSEPNDSSGGDLENKIDNQAPTEEQNSEDTEGEVE